MVPPWLKLRLSLCEGRRASVSLNEVARRSMTNPIAAAPRSRDDAPSDPRGSPAQEVVMADLRLPRHQDHSELPPLARAAVTGVTGTPKSG